MDELVHEFLVESHENLDQLDRDLVLLEQGPDAHDLLASIFRTVHTIKGTSGLLGFTRLEALAHAAESLLARVRDGQASATPATTEVLLRTVDVVRELLTAIEETGTEGTLAVDGVVAEIENLRDHTGTAPDAGRPGAPPTPPAPQRTLSEATVRVGVDVLDELMELVEELLSTRDLVALLAGTCPPDVELTRVATRLDVVARALHDKVLQARMRPIGHLWAKLPRIVRDLGAQSGKRVRMAMEGHDTELDRALLATVKDPLTHLVRNAVDHGVETPGARLAAGKSPEGTVTLRARRDDGHLVLEVCDDGAGIDPVQVAAAARRAGNLTAAELEGLSRAEVLGLVLLPGFSTATSVTHLSGRGVGMDVVRTNVEHLGGTVEIDSEVGHGTTCRLRIPIVASEVPVVAPA